MMAGMSKPYAYIEGDPTCGHKNVEKRVLAVIPPISVWKCRDCGREVRERHEPPEPSKMPVV